MDPSPEPLAPAGGRLDDAEPAGLRMFARYAFPPNELGYCGPAGASVLLEHATSGGVAHEIVSRAREFDGAWPYLEVIAAACGIDDPLDARVVEAYWIGNDLLEKVDPDAFLATLGTRFAGQAGGIWDRISSVAGPLAHHSFHVFAVYPWFSLLGGGNDVPLKVLDQCRIRWGTVVAVEGEHAMVRSQPLSWNGRAVSLGSEREESVRWSAGGRALRMGLAPGDLVTLHWDWVCDRLVEEQATALRSCSELQMDLVNRHGMAIRRG